jgi:hypothetical protein
MFDEATLTTVSPDFKYAMDNAQSLRNSVNNSFNAVADLVASPGPITNYDYSLAGCINTAANLKMNILALDASQTSTLTSIDDLIETLSAHIGSITGVGAMNMATYQPGTFATLPYAVSLCQQLEATSAHNTQISDTALQAIQNASVRSQERYEEALAKQREEQGKWGVLLGLVTVGALVLGAVVTVATCGLGAPVVAGLIITGVGAAFALSDTAEAAHNWYLGAQGDGTSKSFNFMRDTVLRVDDETYDKISGVVTTVAGFAMPVGGAMNLAKQGGTSMMKAGALAAVKETGEELLENFVVAPAATYGAGLVWGHGSTTANGMGQLAAILAGSTGDTVSGLRNKGADADADGNGGSGSHGNGTDGSNGSSTGNPDLDMDLDLDLDTDTNPSGGDSTPQSSDSGSSSGDSGGTPNNDAAPQSSDAGSSSGDGDTSTGADATPQSSEGDSSNNADVTPQSTDADTNGTDTNATPPDADTSTPDTTTDTTTDTSTDTSTDTTTDTTTPETDTTTPDTDSTIPETDTTTTDADTTTPETDTSTDTTTHDGETTSTDADTTTPDGDTTTTDTDNTTTDTDTDTTSPESDTTTPEAETTTPESDSTTPEPDTTTPEGDTISTDADTTTSDGDTTTTDTRITSPESETITDTNNTEGESGSDSESGTSNDDTDTEMDPSAEANATDNGDNGAEINPNETSIDAATGIKDSDSESTANDTDDGSTRPAPNQDILNEYAESCENSDKKPPMSKEVLNEYALVYADLVDTNQPWKWRENVVGAEYLTDNDRSAIKEAAVNAGYIADIPITTVQGQLKELRIPDFSSVSLGSIDMPKVWDQPGEPKIDNLWLASDNKQFSILDRLYEQQYGVPRPEGTTWHHTIEEGKMELIPFGIHNVTNHNGGRTEGEWADAPR